MERAVIITGASGGIGQATARVFAAHGWNLVLGYNRNKERATTNHCFEKKHAEKTGNLNGKEKGKNHYDPMEKSNGRQRV